MDNINLNSFLKFGYFLDYKNPNYKIDLSGIDKEKYKDATENELIDIGIKLWKEAIQKQFNPNEKHVVPLSGGLDSRAILAALLEFTEAKNIYTYTFGTPGTLDYDIGNMVAKKVGTNHTKFPLTEHKYTIEEEIDISKRIDYQTVLFHHPPVWELVKKFSNCCIWSGFMGDPIAGSHIQDAPSTNIKYAKDIFKKKNRYVSSIDLTNIKFKDSNGLISSAECNKYKLTLDEQLDFENRQLKYIAPHVLMKGFKYKTPFLTSEWFNFILSVDNKYRKDMFIYKKNLLNAFTIFFKLPTKNNYGLPLTADRKLVILKKMQNKIQCKLSKIGLKFPNPNINYLDFDEGIRTREDLKKIIYESIMDLKKRKIVDWIDIDVIWKRHINKQVNHADALLVLASLEIHLKAGKKI